MLSRHSDARRRLVSLRRRFLGLLTGVVALFAMGMSLSVMFSLHSNKISEQRLLNVEAAQAHANVLRRLDYYREAVDSLARDPELLDLMQVGTVEDMQQWAMSRRQLLPNVLGLALVSPQGEIFGDSNLLRVGPSCQRDLHQQGTHTLDRVLIHRDVPGLEHVDLVAAVREPGGEMLGKVFVSLQLGQLQRVIEDSTQTGHAITLLDAAGEPVVSSGVLQGQVYEVSVPLPAMGWRLRVQAPGQPLSRSGWMQILAGLFTLASVLTLLVVAVLRLRGPVRQDIAAALDALACLTRNESAPPIVPRHVEFEPVATDINLIARNLQEQRARLEHLSLTDPLTGLPNRRAFETRFPQAQGLAERQHSVALVMLDIDHFKGVNDRYGHGVGDQVLLALAQSLKALTRRADLAARLAGDEFVVLLSGLDPAGVDAWHQRLSEHFRSELNTFGRELNTGLSAGQTWLGEVSGDTLNDALARADRALYRAKAQGRGRLVQDAAPGEDAAG
jgi:diguanylate cyclase (GGDEF)-like protein